MSKFICNICNNTFAQKKNLQIHLSEKRCKAEIAFDLFKLNDYITNQKQQIEELQKQINITGDKNAVGANVNCCNEINMKIEININPITKLNVNYLDTDKMKLLIEDYDKLNTEKNPERLNMLLSGYIKDVICDAAHPENHAVKYIKKKPPTFNAVTEDPEGNSISVIKGLKDTCELLSDPVLETLKAKMKEFVNKYRKDTEPEFDYGLYEDAIKQLKKELNKANVKKALGSVLKNDILNNIEMKLSGSIKPKVAVKEEIAN